MVSFWRNGPSIGGQTHPDSALGLGLWHGASIWVLQGAGALPAQPVRGATGLLAGDAITPGGAHCAALQLLARLYLLRKNFHEASMYVEEAMRIGEKVAPLAAPPARDRRARSMQRALCCTQLKDPLLSGELRALASDIKEERDRAQRFSTHFLPVAPRSRSATPVMCEVEDASPLMAFASCSPLIDIKDTPVPPHHTDAEWAQLHRALRDARLQMELRRVVGR